MTVCAVVGGQLGSEGKGLVVGHIAKDYDHHVRVGAANAGHTLYTERPVVDPDNPANEATVREKHVMQQLPCAAYAHPEATLYVGPGALISKEILLHELSTLCEWRGEQRLGAPIIVVDPRAHIITADHIRREAETDLQDRIGSTSTTAREGIGAAQAARVMREDDCVLAGDDGELERAGLIIADVPMWLDEVRSEHTLLEGTQGTGLSLTTGPFPYCTSRNTTAAGLCADAGVAPTRLDRVILVCRTYPIRVAGNSGPWGEGSVELQWEDIGIDPGQERTTVTKKVRRVASISLPQIAESAALNGATEIALTFTDYLAPGIAAQHGPASKNEVGMRWSKVAAYVSDIEEATGVPVTMLGTGPDTVIELED